MDTRPRLARATRFFARLLSFDLECPRCGEVFQVRTQYRGEHVDRQAFDPTTSRFTCTACQRTYVMGILAWPVSGGGRNIATAAPRDQVPNARQLSSLRKEGQGWWLADADRIRRPIPDESNLTLERDRRQATAKYAEDVDEDN